MCTRDQGAPLPPPSSEALRIRPAAPAPHANALALAKRKRRHMPRQHLPAHAGRAAGLCFVACRSSAAHRSWRVHARRGGETSRGYVRNLLHDARSPPTTRCTRQFRARTTRGVRNVHSNKDTAKLPRASLHKVRSRAACCAQERDGDAICSHESAREGRIATFLTRVTRLLFFLEFLYLQKLCKKCVPGPEFTEPRDTAFSVNPPTTTLRRSSKMREWDRVAARWSGREACRGRR